MRHWRLALFFFVARCYGVPHSIQPHEADPLEAESEVIAVHISHHYGDRPPVMKPVPNELSRLGEMQLRQAGTLFRNRYINPTNFTYKGGRGERISFADPTPGHAEHRHRIHRLTGPSQISIWAPQDSALLRGSAVAFSQGLLPVSTELVALTNKGVPRGRDDDKAAEKWLEAGSNTSVPILMLPPEPDRDDNIDNEELYDIDVRRNDCPMFNKARADYFKSYTHAPDFDDNDSFVNSFRPLLSNASARPEPIYKNVYEVWDYLQRTDIPNEFSGDNTALALFDPPRLVKLDRIASEAEVKITRTTPKTGLLGFGGMQLAFDIHSALEVAVNHALGIPPPRPDMRGHNEPLRPHVKRHKAKGRGIPRMTVRFASHRTLMGLFQLGGLTKEKSVFRRIPGDGAAVAFELLAPISRNNRSDDPLTAQDLLVRMYYTPGVNPRTGEHSQLEQHRLYSQKQTVSWSLFSQRFKRNGFQGLYDHKSWSEECLEREDSRSHKAVKMVAVSLFGVTGSLAFLCALSIFASRWLERYLLFHEAKEVAFKEKRMRQLEIIRAEAERERSKEREGDPAGPSTPEDAGADDRNRPGTGHPRSARGASMVMDCGVRRTISQEL